MAEAKRKDGDATEFLAAWESMVTSLSGVFDRHPKYAWVMKLLLEAERTLSFRVAWIDDSGISRVNRGFRIQYSSALGPYEGPTVFTDRLNYSVCKAKAFDATFRNALSGKVGRERPGAEAAAGVDAITLPPRAFLTAPLLPPLMAAHRRRVRRQRLQPVQQVRDGDPALLPVVHDGAVQVHRQRRRPARHGRRMRARRDRIHVRGADMHAATATCVSRPPASLCLAPLYLAPVRGRYGQYKRINQHCGQLGKGLLWGGSPAYVHAQVSATTGCVQAPQPTPRRSLLSSLGTRSGHRPREHANPNTNLHLPEPQPSPLLQGMGLAYFAKRLVEEKGQSLAGKRCLITGRCAARLHHLPVQRGLASL